MRNSNLTIDARSANASNGRIFSSGWCNAICSIFKIFSFFSHSIESQEHISAMRDVHECEKQSFCESKNKCSSNRRDSIDGNSNRNAISDGPRGRDKISFHLRLRHCCQCVALAESIVTNETKRSSLSFGPSACAMRACFFPFDRSSLKKIIISCVYLGPRERESTSRSRASALGSRAHTLDTYYAFRVMYIQKENGL